MKVLLGPAHELHVGVHGSLVAAPPPGVSYVRCPYTLHFRPDRDARHPFSPLHDPAVSEWVRFTGVPAGTAVVHSSRLPVRSPLPWVVDADSLLTPLRVGRFFALGAAARGDPPFPDPPAVARREAAMAARYADRRCARLLFRTEYARRMFLDHLSHGGHRPETVETLAGKSEAVYPAVPAAAPRERRAGPVCVLYMGRTAQDKGAEVAAEVFLQLRERHGSAVRPVFLGPCPAGLASRLAAAGVELVPVLPRTDYLERLRRADVFLSPTSFESFGMGLLEAAAAGLAVVCPAGPGMEHIGELFTAGENALFVTDTGPPARQVAMFTAAVSALIRDEPLRRRLSMNNHALTSRGKLSLRRRDERLGAVYAHAAALGASTLGDADRTRARTEAESECDRPVTTWAEEVCHWAGQHCAARIGGRVVAR
ncbi:glycosyltransferase [Streptomyces sp. NPDC049555]|uniref:glycosyltransferase n=1 Tax=Streptomyces sp. NPDC049555 TaxID=3154930 RepID=UPI00341CE323